MLREIPHRMGKKSCANNAPAQPSAENSAPRLARQREMQRGYRQRVRDGVVMIVPVPISGAVSTCSVRLG
jgi:hypothetical protein